jgi:hypothetical protein
MTQIADVYARLLLDDKEAKKTLTQDLPQEAAKGGQKAGQSFGGAMGTAVRTTVGAVAGGVLGGLFGMASKATAELNTAMSVFAAETGATQDEIESAQKTISSLYRSNLQGFNEIGDALGKMRTDLGMTQEEANAAADSFLEFATATRQDAGEAVSAFDDILDSWGLTAKDAQGIMDRLVAGHRKFGGSVKDNQKTLAALAPSMRAANMEIDDGIGLLNLFGAKGLDAGVASAAFSKALTKVKSPEELQTLITQISQTEDPFQRAALAADLFGAKAGAKLANALGGVNLADYSQGIDEVAGSSADAAAAIEGSFGNQFQLMMKNAGGALAEFGSQFGPILLVAGQFGPSLFAKMGGAIGGLAGMMSKRMFLVGKTAGLRLAAGLASTSVGTAIVSNVGSMMDSVGGKLGAKGGKLGDILGSKLGKAAGVAFAAVMVAEVWNTYNEQKAGLENQGKEIGTAVGEQIATGTVASLEQSKAALEQGLRDINGVWDAGIFTTDSRKNLEKQLADVNAELERRALTGGQAIGSATGTGISQGVAAAVPVVQVAADKVVETFGISLSGIKRAAGQTGTEGMLALSQAVTAARQLPLDAFDALVEMLKNPMSRTKEAARLAGQLTSKALAEGLRSNDPAIRAQAEATKQAIIDRLTALSNSSGEIGRKGGAALAAGLRSKDPQIRAAAQAAKKAIDDKLAAAKGSASTAGQNAGAAFSQGVQSGVGSTGFRFNGSFAFRGGMRALASGDWNVARDQVALIHQGEMVVPARPAAEIRAAAASPVSSSSRSSTQTVNVYNPSPEPASQSVSRELRKLAYMGAVS